MSFSVGKSEKIRNPAYSSDFPENSKNSGHSSSIRSGPSYHSVSSFFPETVLFFLPFSFFFQKSFFPSGVSEKILIFRKFSLSPSFRPFFLPAENFPDFFARSFPVSENSFFSFVCSLFLNIFFSENVKIQRIKRQTVNFSDRQNPKDFTLLKRFFFSFSCCISDRCFSILLLSVKTVLKE